MGQDFLGGATQGLGTSLQQANARRQQQEQQAAQLELQRAQFDFQKKQLDVSRKAEEDKRKRIETAFKALQQAQSGTKPASGPVPGTESLPPSGTTATALSPAETSQLQFDAAGTLAAEGNPNAAGQLLSRLLPPTREDEARKVKARRQNELQLKEFDLAKQQAELRERQFKEQQRQFNSQQGLQTQRTEAEIKLKLAQADKARAQATGTTTILPDGTVRITPGDAAKKIVTPARAKRAAKFDEQYDAIQESNRKIGQLHQFLSENPNAAGLSNAIAASVASGTERLLSLNPEVKGPKAQALVNALRTQGTDAANKFDFLFNSVLFQVAADNQQNRGILTDDDVKRAEKQLGGKFGLKPTASTLLPRLESLLKNQTDSADRAFRELEREGLGNKPPLEFPFGRQTLPARPDAAPSAPVTPQGGASGFDPVIIQELMRRAAAGDTKAQAALDSLPAELEVSQ